jgi:Glycosyl transferase family 2
MRFLSVVIPALNEERNVAAVIGSVPVDTLRDSGWETEIIVVDNASTDATGEAAAAAGATVVHESRRGYGSAYKAGFGAARGDVIVTGDADRTYPLDHTPGLLETFWESGTEFLTTNRLIASNRRAMKPSHSAANHFLSGISRMLFRHDIRDSQSGMWMFRRYVWEGVNVLSDGMAFSQEIKNEARRCGFRTAEVPIEYRPRGGEVKLNAVRDGVRNLTQLFSHRLRSQPELTVWPAPGTVAPGILSPGAVSPGILSPGTVSPAVDPSDASAETVSPGSAPPSPASALRGRYIELPADRETSAEITS